ncbi:MAG: hypothetical protein GX224_02765 [Thermoplasmatales archaeon]|nr:hypothetical protein [Thermoplasmatales archaeon]
MDPGNFLLMVVLSSALGSSIGVFTGLVPGIHVNTAAAALLTAYPAMDALLSPVTGGNSPAFIAAVIVSAATVHSFVDYVPSVFMGAPDADDSLVVLPGHRLLMEGRGMAAVRASAVGSLAGCVCSLALAMPLAKAMEAGLSDLIARVTVAALAIIMVALVCKERTLRDAACTAMLLGASGLFGWVCLTKYGDATGPMGFGNMLFPMLTGLFGLPALVDSMGNPEIPVQRDEGAGVGLLPGIKGVVAGSVTGWFPGVTASACAAVSSMASENRDAEEYISTVSSVGTASVVFALITLISTGRQRSGAMVAVADVTGGNVPFTFLLGAVACGAVVGFFATVAAGRFVSNRVSGVDMRKFNAVVIAALVAMAFASGGLLGLAVLAVAAALGTLPLALGVGRVALSGSLIVPAFMAYLF